jgi:hypothetical protein
MNTAMEPVDFIPNLKQKKLLREMPEPLRRIALHGCRLVRGAHGALVLGYYQLGTLAQRALREEHLTGLQAMYHLSHMWKLSPERIHKYIDFAKAFDEETVKDWCGRQFVGGKPDELRYLSLSHWLLIVNHVEEPEKREEILLKIVREGLSVGDLVALFKESRVRRRAGGGRPFKNVHSPNHGLVRLAYTCNKLVRWEDEVFFDHVLADLRGLSAAKVDEDLIQNVKSAIQATAKVAETSTDARRELEKVLERLECLAKNNDQASDGQATKSQATNGKAPRGATRAEPAMAPDDEFAEPVGVGERKK